MAKDIHFKIKRQDDPQTESYWEEFKMPYAPAHNVVSALMDVKKPFDVDEFAITIERILRRKGLLVDPEEELHSTIGRRVRELRKSGGLTLKQMSNRTGLSISLLSQIERAESSASVSSLFKLASAMGCKISDFFGDF